MWKNMVNKSPLLLFLLFLVSSGAFSQDNIDVSIRFFNKQLYYPEDSIIIKIEITNNSADTFRFKLADNRMFNIDFTVRTISNRILSQSDDLIKDRHSDQHIFFREVSIGPGEQYAFFEDLTDYIDVSEPGKYIIQAFFYPDLLKMGMPSHKIGSNSLSMSVRPEERELELLTFENTVELESLQKRKLPPDEVVAWTINARQQSDWKKFFNYIHLESLLKNNPSRERRYLRLSQEEQRRMLAEYKDDLMNATVDGDIVVIPEEYEIIKTEYTPEEATVLVRMKFQYPGYKEVKEYTYYLRKRDNVWTIYDYDVRNLGTE